MYDFNVNSIDVSHTRVFAIKETCIINIIII